MIHRTNNQKIKEYFDSPRVSQSLLKEVLRGAPTSLAPKSRRDGSIIDAFLTMSPEDVDEFYAVSPAKRPSEAVQTILNKAYLYLREKGHLTDDIYAHKHSILKQTEFEGYSLATSEDKRFEGIAKKAGDWWYFMVNNIHKEIISEDERSFGYQIAEEAKNHKKIGVYFRDHPNLDIYYQLPIYFEMDGVKCKALLDHVVVNNVKRLITISDIKTIYLLNVDNFAQQARDLNYPFQLSFYRQAVLNHFKLDYEIKAQWIFIGKDLKNGFRANVIPCPTVLLDLYRDGFHRKGDLVEIPDGTPFPEGHRVSKKVYGWIEALHLYKNHDGSKSYHHLHTRDLSEREVLNLIL